MTEFLHMVVRKREREQEMYTLREYVRPSMSYGMQEAYERYERMVANATRTYATDTTRPRTIMNARNGNSYVCIVGNLYVTQLNYPLPSDIQRNMVGHSNIPFFSRHRTECADSPGFVLNRIGYGNRSYDYACIECGNTQTVTMPIIPIIPTMPGLFT